MFLAAIMYYYAILYSKNAWLSAGKFNLFHDLEEIIEQFNVPSLFVLVSVSHYNAHTMFVKYVLVLGGNISLSGLMHNVESNL